VLPIPGSLLLHSLFNPVTAAEESEYDPLTGAPLVQQA
jgi:hypothetical protein